MILATLMFIQVFDKDSNLALDVEKLFDCCGFDTLPANVTETCGVTNGPACAQGASPSCDPCKASVEDKIDAAFNASGGVGLFFAFTQVSLMRLIPQKTVVS